MSTPTNPLAPQDIGNGLTSDVFGQQSMASPPVKPGAVKSFLAQMFQGAADAGAAHLGLPTSFDRQQAAIKNQQQKQALDQKGQEMQAEAARWTAMAQQIQAQSTPVAYADDFAEDFGLPKGGQMPQSAYTALAKVRETAKAKLGAAQIGAGARIGAAQIGQGINPSNGQSNTPGTLGDVLGSDHPLAGMPITKFSLGLANAMLTAQGKNKRMVNANGRITLQDIGQVPAGTDFGAATGTLMPGISAQNRPVQSGDGYISAADAIKGNAPLAVTSATRRAGEQGGAVIDAGNDLIGFINQHRDKIGNPEAVIQAAFLGTPLSDPLQQEAAAKLQSFWALNPALHGFRSQQAVEHFHQATGGLANNPDSLIGGIKGIMGTAGIVQRNAHGAAQATHRYNPATGKIEAIR